MLFRSPLAFPVDETPKILGILQMICKIYIIAVSLRFISASLNVVHEIYNRKESLKNKPLKGFIQLLQVAVFFIGFILIISILIGIFIGENVFRGVGGRKCEYKKPQSATGQTRSGTAG